MHHPTDKLAHSTVLVNTSRGAMAGRRNILMGPPSYYKQMLYHGISDAMTMSAMIPRKC